MPGKRQKRDEDEDKFAQDSSSTSGSAAAYQQSLDLESRRTKCARVPEMKRNISQASTDDARFNEDRSRSVLSSCTNICGAKRSELATLLADALQEYGFTDAANILHKEYETEPIYIQMKILKQFRDALMHGEYSKARALVRLLPYRESSTGEDRLTPITVEFVLLREQFLELIADGNQIKARTLLQTDMRSLLKHGNDIYARFAQSASPSAEKKIDAAKSSICSYDDEGMLEQIGTCPWGHTHLTTSDSGLPQDYCYRSNCTNPCSISCGSRTSSPSSHGDSSVTTPQTHEGMSFIMRCLSFAFRRNWRGSPDSCTSERISDQSGPTTELHGRVRSRTCCQAGTKLSMEDDIHSRRAISAATVSLQTITFSGPRQYELCVPFPEHLWTIGTLHDLAPLCLLVDPISRSRAASSPVSGQITETSDGIKTEFSHVQRRLMRTTRWLGPSRGSRSLVWQWLRNHVFPSNLKVPGYISSLIAAPAPTSPDLVGQLPVASCQIQNETPCRCIQILSGHDSEVWSVATSPNQNLVASGDRSGVIRLWARKQSVESNIDSSEFTLAAILTGHSDAVSSLSWSKDGQHLASCSDDKTTCIWHIADHVGPQTIYDASNIGTPIVDHGALQLSPADRTLARHLRPLEKVVWCADGQRLLTASVDGHVILWDVQAEQPVLCEWHFEQVLSMSHVPFNKNLSDPFYESSECSTPSDMVAILSAPRRLYLLFIDTSTCDVNLVSRDGDPVACLPSSHQRNQKLRSNFGLLQQRLCDSDYVRAYDSMTKVVECSMNHLLSPGLPVGAPPRGVLEVLREISDRTHMPSAHDCAVGSTFGTCLHGYIGEICDDTRAVQTKKDQSRFVIRHHSDETDNSHDENITVQTCSSVTLDSTGVYAAIGAQNLPIILWNLQSGKIVRRFWGHVQQRYVLKPAFGGPCNAYLAIGSEDCSVCVWRRSESQVMAHLRGHTGVVNDVCWVNDTTIISASDDGTLRVWAR